MRGLIGCVLAIAACGGSSATPGDDAPPGDGSNPPTDGDPGDGPTTTGDAPPDPCAPGTWCTEDPPSASLNLRSVWAADLNNVFAVGEGGVILHRHDNTWTAMASGTTKPLQGVWGISATDVWAGGDDGTLLHYDGQAWTPKGAFTTQDFNQIWASSTDDVWFTAGTGVVHWDGNQFQTMALPGTVYSISGTGPNDIWVTGEQAKVDHYTGTWQTGIETGGTATNFGILALPNEAWVSGFKSASASTFHFASSAWNDKAVPAGTIFRQFHGVSATDIWAAGQNDVGHYDGASWTVESPAGAGGSMFGIGGIGGSFWVVGSSSLILHRR